MKLLLFTYRKSHTGFPLVLKLVTLNDLESHNGRYFALFHPVRYFGAKYITVVEVIPILSKTEMLPKEPSFQSV